MKIMPIAAIAAGAVSITLAAAIADTEADATYKDMQQTLGFVPGFFKAFPDHGIGGAWDEMKVVLMNPKTALPGKTKELIGLAVAAQIPCKYCVYFHTSIAKADGANDQELKEAVAIAALERHWGTVLDGLQIDPQALKQDVAKMFQKQPQPPPPSNEAPAPVTDAQTAFKDMERTMGMVPQFMKQFPEAAVAPAWKEMRSLRFSRDTALDAKTKDLIGLGVAAQMACSHCVFFNTEAAKHDGASDAEIREAIAVAALTRHWSTVINGSLIDEAAFKKDVDHIVRSMTEKAPKAAQK